MENINYDFTNITNVIEAMRFIDRINPEIVRKDYWLISECTGGGCHYCMNKGQGCCPHEIRNGFYRVNHWLDDVAVFVHNHWMDIDNNVPIRLVHLTKVVLNGASMSRVIWEKLFPDQRRFIHDSLSLDRDDNWVGYEYEDLVEFMNWDKKSDSKFELTFYWSPLDNKIVWRVLLIGPTSCCHQRELRTRRPRRPVDRARSPRRRRR